MLRVLNIKKESEMMDILMSLVWWLCHILYMHQTIKLQALNKHNF